MRGSGFRVQGSYKCGYQWGQKEKGLGLEGIFRRLGLRFRVVILRVRRC